MNILFTNAGRRTYLIEFALELCHIYNDLNIFVSDCDSTVPSFSLDKNIISIKTPKVINNENNYFSILKKEIIENKIDLLIPLSDLDLGILAIHRNELIDLKCFPVVSNKKFIDSCMDKKKFYEFCHREKLMTPELIDKKSINEANLPIVRKNILGSGSNDLKFIKYIEEINFEKSNCVIYQKLILGSEYHIDILNDLQGNYISHCVKEKVLMRSGETDKAFVVHNKLLDKFAFKISKATKHVGNLDCDIIVDEKKDIYCIDFNPRFGGGYPITHLSGMNYIKTIIDLYLGRKISLPKIPDKIFVSKGISVHKVNS